MVRPRYRYDPETWSERRCQYGHSRHAFQSLSVLLREGGSSCRLQLQSSSIPFFSIVPSLLHYGEDGDCRHWLVCSSCSRRTRFSSKHPVHHLLRYRTDYNYNLSTIRSLLTVAYTSEFLCLRRHVQRHYLLHLVRGRKHIRECYDQLPPGPTI